MWGFSGAQLAICLITKHKKALHALLPVGLARRHRGIPAASLILRQLYATPVLSKDELDVLTLQNLLRLHERTPRAIVYFGTSFGVST